MKISNALRLISVLTEMIPTSSKLVKVVLHSMSSNVISNMLRQYSSQMPGTTHLGFAHGHSTTDVCPSSYHETQARLHQSLAVMILESALYTSQCGGHFDVSVMKLLLERTSCQPPPPHASVECIQRRRNSILTPKISLFEAVSTPPVDSVSLNWRDDLIREMSRDVNCQYEGVIRMVGEICRDLELRCNEIEGPLREEQSKSRDLEARLENLENDKAELEIQAQNHQSALSVLEDERDRLAKHVEATERQLEELGTSLDNIHQEFDHAKIEGEYAAQAAIESARQRDLAYLATMTGKDEMLEEQILKLASTEDRVKTLDHEINHLRELEAKHADKLRSSEKHVETLNNAVSASESRAQDLHDELHHTKEQEARNMVNISSNEALISELNSTVVAMNEASDRNDSLISHIKHQLQQAEVEISELRLQHETYATAKEAEIKRLDESNRTLNEKWQSELEVASRNAATASEQIAGLHNKIGKLRREREVCIFRNLPYCNLPDYGLRDVSHSGVYRPFQRPKSIPEQEMLIPNFFDRSGLENLQKLKS